MTEISEVKYLGERIGFGRMMQLAEEMWEQKDPGGAHSVGPCTFFLVPCPHSYSEGDGVKCEWCCGSGRVTRKVLEAMQKEKE